MNGIWTESHALLVLDHLFRALAFKFETQCQQRGIGKARLTKTQTKVYTFRKLFYF